MKSAKNIVIIPLALLALIALLIMSKQYDRFLEPLIPNRPAPTEATVADETISEETVPVTENDAEEETTVTDPDEDNGRQEHAGNSDKPEKPKDQEESRPVVTPTTPTEPTKPIQPDKPEETEPTEPTAPPNTEPVAPDEEPTEGDDLIDGEMGDENSDF